ncbi:MAG: TRIC cation channel family protein [Oscillibacter sp.]|nr:TRIC cation channel family protein [Oscillibacter sp.]
MELFILVIELAGTMAFAASGAMTGMKKDMDIFGICILALTTAVGGGVIRDLILGNTPPNTFRNPVYATVAILTALVLFLPWVRRFLMRDQRLYDTSMLVLDTAGLGIFTVVGMRIAYSVVPSPTLFLLVFVGVVTGVGGGVIRDMMAGDTPYIFVKHIYACASLAGALVCAALWDPAGEVAAMAVGMTVVMVIRLLSAHYHWNLPKAHD